MRDRLSGCVAVWTVALFFLLATVVQAEEGVKPVVPDPIEVDGLTPAAVSVGGLQPGLESFYYLKFFERHLEFLPPDGHVTEKSFKGKPVLELNHQFGEGEVFGSGTNRGVGMRLKGLIRFDQVGLYRLQALSNDGVLVIIDGKIAVNDPEQHSDRLSNIALVKIDQSGWYPLVVEYFQRKGTATLKLSWQTPDTSDYTPIPPVFYAHQK